MNKFIRTFFIFLLLLSTRQGIASHAQSITHDNRSRQGVAEQKYQADHALTSLEEFQQYPPIQPWDTLDELMVQAVLAKAELKEVLTHISQQTGTDIIIAPNKSLARAEQKVSQKFDGDVRLLTDITRGSIIANNLDSLTASYQQLATNYEVIQLKNRFAHPKASGYRDLNALIKLPNSHMIVEVQFHLADIAEIKSGAEHQTYQRIQAIEAMAQAAHRPLSEHELMQITKLRQHSHKQYHKAWLGYKNQATTIQAA